VYVSVYEHEGKEKTGREMYGLVNAFAGDLGVYASMSFPDFFRFVAGLPYIADDELFRGRVVEVVARPRWLLDGRLVPALDCKKKSILIGAWAKANGFPFRFVAVSHLPNKKIHHVMPQIDFGNGWVNVDATFSNHKVGEGQPITYAEVLKP